jgi:hypothetical protein
LGCQIGIAEISLGRPATGVSGESLGGALCCFYA